MTVLHPRIVEVIDALEQAHRELVDVVMSIPADRRDAPATEGRWSVAENIEHLALIEDGVGRLISKLTKQVRDAGAMETEESSLLHSIDHFRVWSVTRRIEAPDFVRPTEGLSSNEALARLTSARTKLVDALRNGSGLALATVSHPHPVVGPLNIYQWGIMTAHHQRRHSEQIRQIAGLGDA